MVISMTGGIKMVRMDMVVVVSMHDYIHCACEVEKYILKKYIGFVMNQSDNICHQHSAYLDLHGLVFDMEYYIQGRIVHVHPYHGKDQKKLVPHSPFSFDYLDICTGHLSCSKENNKKLKFHPQNHIALRIHQ